MLNHVRNTMQFRKRLCNKGLQSYGRFCAQVQLKSRKKIEIHFSSICEEGESPRTLLGPSKLEFYGECNGSKYNLIALALLLVFIKTMRFQKNVSQFFGLCGLEG